MINQSNASIKTFAAHLKSKLTQGMTSGGPVAAIQVCHTAAEEIAHKISKQYGWKIARTSLKVRNTDNQPDSWERAVLEQFEQRKNNGEDIQKIAYAAIINSGEQSTFRYMKAIPTGDICLSCHGDKLTNKITEQLDILYPDDKARGFKKNDIRGAFTITRQIN